MSRIIINNKSNMDDLDAIYRVASVIGYGRISTGTYGPQYCFMTVFTKATGQEIQVSARRTKGGTDTFTVVDGGSDNA